MNRHTCSSLIGGAFAIIAVILNPLSAQLDDPDAITWIPEVSTAPVIDGEIDQIWQAQNPFAIEYVQSGSVENEADLSAEWYGLYDETYFYFLIDIHDQFLESEAGSDIWRNDRIEVYFNMDNVKQGDNGHTGDNYQYAFHWNKPDEEFVNNNTFDGIEWTVITTDYGYITEVAIPWTTLTTTLDTSPGFSFGFDIAINDNDGFSTYDSVTYWWNSTGQAEWGNIDGAGTVGLGDPFNGNYGPILAEPGQLTANEGAAVSFPVSATDANAGDSLSFSAEGLPAFASLTDNSDGTATINVNAQPGDANIYDFVMTVSDGSREDSADITLIVKDPNVVTQPPQFDSVADVSVNQGSLLLLDVHVVDLDSLTVEITGTDLPEFASLSDNGDKSATLEFNPGFDVTPQSYSVTLGADDPDNNTDSITFNVVVVETQKLTEFHVDPVNGDIQNDGSAENPWSTLQEVFAAGKLFEAGDVIYLRDGYHGEPVITSPNSGTVIVMPENGAQPRASQISFSSSSSNWQVSGLEISREYAPVISNATLVSLSGNNNTLADCNIFSVYNITGWSATDWRTRVSNGVNIGGTNNLLKGCTILNTAFAVTVGGSFNTVSGNAIHNFRGDGIRGLGNDLTLEYNLITDNYNVDDNHDDGIQSWSSGSTGVGSGVVSRMTIRGNVIIENTDPNRAHQGSLQGIGCFDGMFEDWVVENNVIIVNHYHGISLYGAINCKVINNTVVDQDLSRSPGPTWLMITSHKNWSSAPADEKAYWVGRDNIVKNNLVTALNLNVSVIVDENNLKVASSDLDTYFLAYPFNLRLKAGSPAIDAGTNSDAPALDADGAVRPFDGDSNGTATVDVGAYEFGANSWRGWNVSAGSTADTEDFMGWVYFGDDPWIYAYSLSKHVYFTGEISSDQGGWIYVPGGL